MDRDGVINYDYGYVFQHKDFHFRDKIFELVQYANKRKYSVIIVTNQSGIGRGYYAEDDFEELNNWMLEKFSEHQCKIDAVYYCPDHPVHGIGKYKRDSDYRKPKPGMINRAIKDYNISATESILIGDKMSDIEAGFSAKISKLYLFDPDYENSRKSLVSDIEHTLICSLSNVFSKFGVG